MHQELDILDDKLQQLIQVCQQLRTENTRLRQQLATSQNEGKQLNEKINGAKNRLETLLQQIPEINQ